MISRRVVDAFLTGIPFGIYKAGAGSILFPMGYPIPGALLMAWGALDIVMNMLDLILPDRFACCSLAWLGQRMSPTAIWRERALALDMMISFTIISSMIWFHGIPLLKPPFSSVWDIAVVSNVMSSGAIRVYDSVQSSGPEESSQD